MDRIAGGQSRETVAKTFVPICLAYTRDLDPDVRAQAAIALGWFRREPDLAIPALARLLEDPELFPRSEACEALRDFGPPAKTALPALEKYAERAKGATEREMALEAIARISASAE